MNNFTLFETDSCFKLKFFWEIFSFWFIEEDVISTLMSLFLEIEPFNITEL